MELNFHNTLILAILVSVVFWILTRVKSVNEWYYVTKLRLKRDSISLPLPPGDMGWPLFGNMSSLQALVSGDAETFMNNLVKRYGETGIYKTHLLGKPSILVCAPETYKPVLLDEELFLPTYPTPMISYLRNNVFAKVTGSEHKRLCKLMTGPMNGHEALAMYIGNIKDIVIASLEEWVRVSLDRPIELFSEMRKAFFKVNLQIFLGSSRNSDYIIESIQKYFDDFYNGFLVKGINIPGFAFHRAIKARNVLRRILQKELDDRRTMEKRVEQFQNEKRDLVDLMMEAEDESGKKLEDEDIIELVLVLLFGSYGSPPKAAAWVTIYLHQHPHILQNVKEEQEEIVKKRPSTQKGLSLKEIKQMPYLAKVIDETLRTVSLPPLLFREAKADVNIKGYVVPKGWYVFIWLRGIHLDLKTYSTPKEFDPSRWENHRPKPGSFVPFGAGPRRCIGADVAKLGISTFLHYFLLNYKIEQFNPGCSVLSAAHPNPSDTFLAKVNKY